ncbi:hypothetical protein [Clostridium sp. ZS2-4]|uniref:hypothetical protein n=1 Tax=Clostridium sp. ZS2-4 TaxID=2987703 RepID=UPI00227CAEE2|nr:hypothetical protein [Clostridium sp. ZS2-4]MCY6355582.1 hypothetical protein [Clostridium sp. ZS2-4]
MVEDAAMDTVVEAVVVVVTAINVAAVVVDAKTAVVVDAKTAVAVMTAVVRRSINIIRRIVIAAVAVKIMVMAVAVVLVADVPLAVDLVAAVDHFLIGSAANKKFKIEGDRIRKLILSPLFN